MSSTSDASRTLWYGDSLIGSIPVIIGGYSWQSISIDLTEMNWQGEDIITLKLTGPADGSHICGTVEFMESQNSAYLVAEQAPVPEPSTFLLLGAGLGGFALYRRKFKK